MHFNGPKFRGVLEKFSFGFKKAKIIVFSEENWILSEFFIILKYRRLRAGLAV